LLGFVFTLSFIFAFVVDLLVGQRVSAKSELEGLDIPEMGALAYPEFELKSPS
jgi:Amt family ammonium transporter